MLGFEALAALLVEFGVGKLMVNSWVSQSVFQVVKTDTLSSGHVSSFLVLELLLVVNASITSQNRFYRHLETAKKMR